MLRAGRRPNPGSTNARQAEIHGKRGMRRQVQRSAKSEDSFGPRQGRDSRLRYPFTLRVKPANPSPALCRLAHAPPLLKTFAAEHGPSLRRAERNGSFLPALRAGGFGFRPLEAGYAWAGRTWDLRPLGFAVLAPLGLVFEALVGEKHLFAGGEDKLLTAFRALQDLIVIFHTLLRGSHAGWRSPRPPPVKSDCAGIRRGRTWVPSPTAP
jgi:hypothetical protein